MAIITRPSYRERLILLGANGGGKTKFAGALLGDGSAYPRGVAIDLKGDLVLELPYTILKSPNDLRWKWYEHHNGWVIYRPDPDYTSGSWLDEFLRRMYERAQRQSKGGINKRPFILYVDEGLALSKRGATQWLGQIAVSGRSIGIGLWVASQRPRWIPVEVRSESWRWYVWALGFLDDELEVSRYAKGLITPDQLQHMEDYEFYEIRRLGKTAARQQVRHFMPLEVNAA